MGIAWEKTTQGSNKSFSTSGLVYIQPWREDGPLDKAHRLPNVLAAVRRSRELDLKEIELVLKFEDGKYDVRLDL